MHDIYFEIQRIGNSVKVTAIDARTMREVSIVGPATVGMEMLKRQAVNKLRYVLNKRS